VVAQLGATVRRLATQPALEVTEATALAEIENLDSLRILEAIALVEAEFGVEIDTAGLDTFETAGDVVRAIVAATRRQA
jgi:acyl carrier protein